jgi:hypothetical protein
VCVGVFVCVCVYPLQSYVTEAVPESQAELSEAEISNLDENMDYSLLTRINEEHTDTESGTTEAGRVKEGTVSGVYHQQYKHRIMTSQSFLRVMLNFMQDGCDVSISDRLHACWTEQFGSVLSLGGLGNTGDASSGREETHTEVSSSSLKWSQAIDYGSSSVAHSIWSLTYRICYFSALCIQVVKSPNVPTESDSAVADGDDDDRLSTLQSLGASIAQSFSDLQGEVLGSSEDRFVTFGGKSVFLQPSWIKKVGYVCMW